MLTLTIFVPLLGAFLIGLIPKERTDMVRVAALGVTLVTFALSLGILAQFESGEAGFQLVTAAQWIPDWGIGYTIGLDGVS